MTPSRTRRATRMVAREAQALPRGRRPSFERSRSNLAARLHERREEIEEAVLTRVLAVSDAPEPTDPEYSEGLRRSVTAAVGYSLDLVEVGEERAAAPPPTLLAQARLAARNGVELATVLRRYTAGYVLISDFLVQEVQRSGLGGAELQGLLRSQGGLDRLLAAVSEEHARECRERQAISSEERKAERIERLLEGEAVDTSELGYELGGYHLGVVAKGPEGPEALRKLANSLDRRLLAVRRQEQMTWAWLGGRRPFEAQELVEWAFANRPSGQALAFGEPGQGIHGWRFTHHQARAAYAVALRGRKPLVRYADVALLAAVLKDDLLATSLRRLYLDPLKTERDGGKVAYETLRAYFASGRNVSSAAAALKVDRSTIANRLRAIEATIGRSPASCGPELEAALRLADVEEPS